MTPIEGAEDMENREKTIHAEWTYFSTKEYRSTLIGKAMTFHETRGRLKLTDRRLIFSSWDRHLEIPLENIRELKLDSLISADTPLWGVKLIDLHAIILTYVDERNIPRTVIMVPMNELFKSTDFKNNNTANWIKLINYHRFHHMKRWDGSPFSFPFCFNSSIDNKVLIHSCLHVTTLAILAFGVGLHMILALMLYPMFAAFDGAILSIHALIWAQVFVLPFSLLYIFLLFLAYPFQLTWGKKSNRLKISDYRTQIYSDRLVFTYFWPSMYPIRDLIALKFVKPKEMIDEIPLDMIRSVEPLSDSKDRGRGVYLVRFLPWLFYRRKGQLNLSGVSNDNILRIKLKKKIPIINFRFSLIYFLKPSEPILTDVLYLDIRKDQWDHFIRAIGNYY